MSLDWKRERKPLALIVAVFGIFYFVPLDAARLSQSLGEALQLAQWYAREHVLLCLIPAFFIAGAIGVFVSQSSVIRYLGPSAGKLLSYGVASVSGTVLAVCSCTVLPLFAGIYRMGAGLGPAIAFLYSGPAINALAIILTARVLGVELGLARAIGAVIFSIVIGALMHLIFRREENDRQAQKMQLTEAAPTRPLWQTATFLALQVAVLVFATWSHSESKVGFWNAIYGIKWYLTGASALGLGFVLVHWLGVKTWKVICVALAVIAAAMALPSQPLLAFAIGILSLSWLTAADKGESGEWFAQTWGFAKQIAPLLFAGVLVAGFLLGRPGREALIPSAWIVDSVGGNSLWANFFASVIGAFMYFATLTEVPILQGLIGSGMGKGPALALLLSGPALSLPSMLVIRQIIGTKKTVVYVSLVIFLSTIAGLIFGLVVE